MNSTTRWKEVLAFGSNGTPVAAITIDTLLRILANKYVL